MLSSRARLGTTRLISLHSDTVDDLISKVRLHIRECKSPQCRLYFLPIRSTQEYCSAACSRTYIFASRTKSNAVTVRPLCPFCGCAILKAIKPVRGQPPSSCHTHCRDLDLLTVLTTVDRSELRAAFKERRKPDAFKLSQEYRNQAAIAKFNILPRDLDDEYVAARERLSTMARDQLRAIRRDTSNTVRGIAQKSKQPVYGLHLDTVKLNIDMLGLPGTLNAGLTRVRLLVVWRTLWAKVSYDVRLNLIAWITSRVEEMTEDDDDPGTRTEWKNTASQLAFDAECIEKIVSNRTMEPRPHTYVPRQEDWQDS